jgi:hypothetical protein
MFTVLLTVKIYYAVIKLSDKMCSLKPNFD